MIDSHAHLFISPVVDILDTHLSDFKKDGGTHILNVAIDIPTITTVISQSINYEHKYPNLILTGLGIHPEEVSKNYTENEKSLSYLVEMLEKHKNRVVCVGECGLDYYHLENQSDMSNTDKEDIVESQKNMFKEHVLLALKYNLPLSIHTRDRQGESLAVFDALKILSTVGKGNVKGVFHSYTGSQSGLEEILNLGFYVGFNGIVTYPKAENVREILKNTPKEKILLETDCPFLPPQKARNGKRTNYKYGKPQDIYEIGEYVSDLLNMKTEEVFDLTDTNFRSLFLSH